MASPLIAASATPADATPCQDTVPTPATLAELQALLPAEDGVGVRLRLTPGLARQILAHNRRVTDPGDARVAELARTITSGQWNPDFPFPAMIFVSQNLRVAGGWHRLQAVDLADRPIIVDIAREPGQAFTPGPALPISVPPVPAADPRIAQRLADNGGEA